MAKFTILPTLLMGLTIAGTAHASTTYKDGKFDVNISGSDSQNYGGNGSSAGSVTLNLSYTDATKSKIQVTGETTKSGKVTSISQVLPVAGLKQISIEAIGGAAGNGYDGQSGSDGSNGYQGQDGHNGSDGCPAGSGWSGSNGGNGGSGGSGGDGGNGGNGGNGGAISINVPADQSEILMLVAATSQAGPGGSGGSGGAGGRGGSGGAGGSGGRGGSSTCTDDKGNRTGFDGSNGSSGSSGSNGSDGSSGSNGSGGYDGRPGVLKYVTTDASGTHSYGDPLRVQVTGIKMVDDNEDGVLEPGEKLHLLSITIINKSSMPTPVGQTINLVLQSNAVLALVTTPAISFTDVIPGGASKTLTYAKGAFVFQAVNQIAAIGKNAAITAKLSINSIALNGDLSTGFALHWPVASTAAVSSVADFFGSSKVINFAIKNVGSQNIGPSGDQPVQAQITWTSSSVPGKDVTIKLADGRSFNLAQPAVVDDFAVKANSTLAVPLSVLIANSKKALTASGTLKLELHLKDLSSTIEDKVDSSQTVLALATDLRPVAIGRAFNLENYSIECTFPNGLISNYTVDSLSLSKAKGKDNLSVSFTTKELFNSDQSPVYAISAYDFAPFSASLSGQPSVATVVSFLNKLLVPQTRRGDPKWAISSCARAQ